LLKFLFGIGRKSPKFDCIFVHMAKSRDNFEKDEKEKLRLKKKKEKLEKKEARKANQEKAKDFEDMIAYVDEFGNITSTPPDRSKKVEIDPETISVGVKKALPQEPEDKTRRGKVTFFNSSKGYGFIRDEQSQESIFVHINKCLDPIKENDKVTFTTEKSPKGPSAVGVKLAT
jgi:cold shock CspA family protein